MTERKKISVIIPCYNLGEYIIPSLESIAGEILPETEFIFIDDGSSDDTPSRLDSFCDSNPGCIVIHQENKGVSAARNAGLDIAVGEYVYLLDGDDLLTPGAMSTMLRLIKENPSDVVITPVAMLQDGKIRKLTLPVGEGIYTPEGLFAGCKVFPTMPQLLYRREIITRHSLRFDSELFVGEVYDFTLRYLTFAETVCVAGEYLFYYVMRSSSASHKPDYKKDLTVIDTVARYYREGEKFSSYPSFNATAFKMLMSFSYNKYVKLHLSDPETLEAVGQLLSSPVAHDCIRRVATTPGGAVKERLFALFVLTTGLSGYKLLTKLF